MACLRVSGKWIGFYGYWQSGWLSGNTYNIYQQEIPELDIYTYLLKWITLLESCLGQKLEPDDYIFPHFLSNGIPDPAWEMTHDMVQNVINKFVSGTGLTKAYTLLAMGWCPVLIRVWTNWEAVVIEQDTLVGEWAIGEHVSCHCYTTASGYYATDM